MTTPDAPTPPPPAPGWRLFAIRGVPVYLGKSWPIVAAVIVFTFGPSIAMAMPSLGGGAYLVAFLYALLLLGSVLAHEAGHALVAQGFGHRVDRIVADLWGGHTTYQAETNTPGRSALVALAGPAMNALVAAAAWFLRPEVPVGVPSLLVGALWFSNLFVALFNLLPGLPLDGGFVVDSLVWKATGSRATGQLVAGWCGRVVALGVVAWFVLRPLLHGESPDIFSIMWMALIASFLWQGAGAAIRGARVQRQVDAVDVRTLIRPTVTVRTDEPVGPALARLAAGAVPVVVDGSGRAVGLVGRAVDEIPAHLRDTTPAAAVQIALDPRAVVPWRDDLTTTDLLRAMSVADTGWALVHDGRGQYGLVAADDLARRLGH